ncbi:MAG: hypothetical protein LUP94_04030 [Candidatus Methanomethylicus sp.]|nr:hypothetical protein [Candidatus Methanomethylicus sp.]
MKLNMTTVLLGGLIIAIIFGGYATYQCAVLSQNLYNANWRITTLENAFSDQQLVIESLNGQMTSLSNNFTTLQSNFTALLAQVQASSNQTKTELVLDAAGYNATSETLTAYVRNSGAKPTSLAQVYVANAPFMEYSVTSGNWAPATVTTIVFNASAWSNGTTPIRMVFNDSAIFEFAIVL